MGTPRVGATPARCPDGGNEAGSEFPWLSNFGKSQCCINQQGCSCVALLRRNFHRPELAHLDYDVRAMLPPDNQPYVVPLTDNALHGALAALLADPVLRSRVGAANRARAGAAYDQQAMFTGWARLFDGT